MLADEQALSYFRVFLKPLTSHTPCPLINSQIPSGRASQYRNRERKLHKSSQTTPHPPFSFSLLGCGFTATWLLRVHSNTPLYSHTSMLLLIEFPSLIIQGPSHSPLTNFYLSFTALFKCYLSLSPSPKQNLPLLYHHFFYDIVHIPSWCSFHISSLQFSGECVHVCFSIRQKAS